MSSHIIGTLAASLVVRKQGGERRWWPRGLSLWMKKESHTKPDKLREAGMVGLTNPEIRVTTQDGLNLKIPN